MPQPKKMLILDILHILQKHSDPEHTLSQHRIQELLEKEYGVRPDRKTVKRNLSKLMEFGFPIGYCEDPDKNRRVNRYGEEETILTNWFYEHEFTNGELRLLIDNVMFTGALTQTYRRDLIRKLEGLSNTYFHSVTQKIDMNVYNRLENGEILLTVETLGAAIAGEKQVSFLYNDCGLDGRLHPRLNPDRTEKRYTANPYQLVTANGHPYLICNLDGHEELTHFRLDRITQITLSETAAMPLSRIRGFENGLRLAEYLSEHPNLWSGDALHIMFRCRQNLMNDVVDWFGTNLQIEPTQDGWMTVHVRASESAMLRWAVQYAEAVEVLTPEHLRGKIADTLRDALKKYTCAET